VSIKSGKDYRGVLDSRQELFCISPILMIDSIDAENKAEYYELRGWDERELPLQYKKGEGQVKSTGALPVC